MVPAIDYIGYRITAERIRPLPSKVKAIKEAMVPFKITEFKAYLGLRQILSKPLHHLGTTACTTLKGHSLELV